jgi:DNA-binding CsgD family transcriptional regulator
MLIDGVFGVLQGVVSCAFASAFYRGAAGGFLKERDSRGREYSHEFMRRHAELTPAIPIALANPGVTIIPTRTGLTLADAKLRKTTYYREIMQVQGWRHAVALCFWGDPPVREPIGVFSVYRTDDEKDFSEQEILRLAQVHPFVDAAVNRMYEREAARALRDGVAGAMRDPTRGFAILDWNHRVMHANAAARHLGHMWSKREPVTRVTKHAQKWQMPLDLVIACRELQTEWEAFLIKHPEATGVRRHRRIRHAQVRGLSATVTLIGPRTVGFVQPSFVVELNHHRSDDNSATGTRASSLLAQLTRAELDVALLLAKGLTNQEIADKAGKTVHAVKFLLHRIYQKTAIPNRGAFVAALRSPMVEQSSGDM